MGPLALLATLACLAGCGSAPKRWVPAPLVLQIDHHMGSAVSGPVAPAGVGQPVDTDPASALAVQVELLALGDADLSALESIDRDAVLVAALGAERPLRAAAWQARDTRAATDGLAARFLVEHAADAAGQRVRLGYSRGALPPGVTLVARIREPELRNLAPWIGVAVSRGLDDSLSLALLTRGTAPPEPQLETADPDALEGDTSPTIRPDDQTELVLLSAGTLTVGGEFLLAVPAEPARLAQTRSGPAYILHVTAAPAPHADDPASVPHRLAHARCLAECIESVGLTAPDSLPTSIQHGLQGLRRSTTREAAMRYLADACQAPLAADLALVADRPLLDDLASRLLARHGSAPDARALGHQLEQEALALLAARAMDGSVLPELEAVLIRRAGELARHPGVLTELVTASSSADDLEARLRAENLVFLQDNEPSARLRAYDWLTIRGAAPSGYAPLAERSERRAALRAAADALANPMQPAQP